MSAHSTAQRRLRRLRGALLMFGALIALIFGGVGIAQVFLAPQRNLHNGVIYAGGYQSVRYRTGSGPLTTTDIPIVKLRLDDGTKHTIESTPLFNLFNAAGHDLNVRVQLDSTGYPKRVQYHGKWYGAGPPVWFWIAFGVVLLAVGALLGRAGIGRLWTVPTASAAPA